MPIDASSFRLLVFDWDGTLMDSIGTIVACTQAAVREVGLKEVCDETIRGTIGLGLRETMGVLSPGGDEEIHARILEGYRKHWAATYRDLPLLFAGAGEMLESLAAEGYLLAIATGKSRRGLDYALEQTRLREVFHATRTADESFSKPHPQMLLDILGELGVAARDALMIGDTTYDLEMARGARMEAVAICSGGHGREELERLGALACLDQVVKLAPWLAQRAAVMA